MILMDINGVRAVIRKQDVLTAGMVGQQVEFRFDESWDKMGKTAVFRAGDVTKDATVTNSIAKVPHEVLIPGLSVEIGVYGTKDDGAIVIPTVWAKTNIVEFGADPSGDESLDPTLPIWGQLQEELAEIKESGVGGGITEEQLAETLEAYATIEYVEQNLPAIIDNEVRNHYEPIADFVIDKIGDTGTMTAEQFADVFHEAKNKGLIDAVSEERLYDVLEGELTHYVNEQQLEDVVGDISSALDELHTYAQALINGGGA